MALKPWNLWIDSEYYQRRDIGTLQDQAEFNAEYVSKLREQVWTLQKQMKELSFTTVALIELLVEKGGVDADLLEQRIQAMAAENK